MDFMRNVELYFSDWLINKIRYRRTYVLKKRQYKENKDLEKIWKYALKYLKVTDKLHRQDNPYWINSR